MSCGFPWKFIVKGGTEPQVGEKKVVKEES